MSRFFSMPPSPQPGNSLRALGLSALLMGSLLGLFHPLPARENPVSAQELPDDKDPETRAMVRRLQALADELDPDLNPYANRERVLVIQKRLEKELSLQEQIGLQALLGQELLFSGESLKAIFAFKKLYELHRQNGLRINEKKLRQYLSTAFIRLGEQENCLAQHTPDSCLFPIQGSGIHTKTMGSQSAIKLLEEQLSQFQDDLSARWLLNIAYMTLGKYPDGVPDSWLIPADRFASEHPLPRFYDRAPFVGLDLPSLAGGSILEDFDNDGLLDVVASSWGLGDQIQYFKNSGDGTFQNRTTAAGLTGITGGLNLIHADYDNDGFMDLFILRGGWFGVAGKHPNSLLKNTGDGRFRDVTQSAGLLSFHPTQTAVWLDYDRDGRLDLFIGNETSPKAHHPCELYRGNEDGTFTETAASLGIAAVGFIKGVAAGDVDDDGFPDIFISRMGQPNLLFHNRPTSEGGRRFHEIAQEAGVDQPIHSFPTWFWDYDNDGRLDLFVADYGVRDVGDVAADYLGLPHPGEKARLFRNLGGLRFEDMSRQTGIDRVFVAMGSNFGDVDNDGFLDIYIGTGRPDMEMIIPNRMFRNHEGRNFQEVTQAGGFGHLQKGHGVSFGDIDNDGDQDIYQVIGGAYSGDTYRNALFENPGNDHGWISLKLIGKESNRGALGARIEILLSTAGGSRSIFRTITSGGSFGSSTYRAEIGLGKATTIERVRIRWPSGRQQVLENVAMNGFYQLTEGGELEPRTPPTFRLPGKPPDAGHAHH